MITDRTVQVIPFWITNSRPQSLPQSLVPSLLALCMASAYSGFSLPLGLLAVLGVALGHMGLNLFDDYFDYKKKKSDYRDKLVHQGFRARIGKCTYLTSGQATVHQLLNACFIFCVGALLIGTVIFYFRGTGIIYFALITAFLGISYSGDPLQLSYRGFGELLIGIVFGPLVMLGTFYAACGMLNTTIILISIPVGLLVSNIVYIHSILDFEPDKQIGKCTLAVLLNNKTAMLIILFCILFIPYLIITVGIVSGYLTPYFALTYLTLPIASSLFYMMIEYVRNPQRKFEPRFWMGPITGWDRIRSLGIDWFMIRWFLARNLLSIFCLLIMIAGFIR